MPQLANPSADRHATGGHHDLSDGGTITGTMLTGLDDPRYDAATSDHPGETADFGGSAPALPDRPAAQIGSASPHKLTRIVNRAHRAQRWHRKVHHWLTAFNEGTWYQDALEHEQHRSANIGRRTPGFGPKTVKRSCAWMLNAVLRRCDSLVLTHYHNRWFTAEALIRNNTSGIDYRLPSDPDTPAPTELPYDNDQSNFDVKASALLAFNGLMMAALVMWLNVTKSLNSGHLALDLAFFVLLMSCVMVLTTISTSWVRGMFGNDVAATHRARAFRFERARLLSKVAVLIVAVMFLVHLTNTALNATGSCNADCAEKFQKYVGTFDTSGGDSVAETPSDGG